jgi:hypothetical protein
MDVQDDKVISQATKAHTLINGLIKRDISRTRYPSAQPTKKRYVNRSAGNFPVHNVVTAMHVGNF